MLRQNRGGVGVGFWNVPTAGKGMNLSTKSLVAGLKRRAFWTSTFNPTCRTSTSNLVRDGLKGMGGETEDAFPALRRLEQTWTHTVKSV